MATVVTNQSSSSALRGQSAIVTLNATDAANLSSFTVGQQCVVGSSSKVGYISEIDLRGKTFRVIPRTPDLKFDSTTTPGLLNASDTVSIG